MSTNIIILTGGIGCGKSVVSQLLKVMGYSVYDCDREAKSLMTRDTQLVHELTEAFGSDTYLPDGSLNKPYLASTIFTDADNLLRMNSLVHPAVGRDIRRLLSVLQTSHQTRHTLFVETAIYYESGFSRQIEADQVWCIASPMEVRIARAMRRDNCTRQKIVDRINSQMTQEEKIERADAVIWNDDTHSLIEQIHQLLSSRKLQ